MEWSGEASVMTRRRHGENAVILTVLARDAGLISGLVPGGASTRRAAMRGATDAMAWSIQFAGISDPHG